MTTHNDTDESLDDVELPYEETVNSSEDEDNGFTLEALDAIIKKRPDDVRFRAVSQYLHLVQDQGFSKLSASMLLAQSVNRGPWHACLIRSWANQQLNQGEITMSCRGHHAKILSFLSNENLKLRIIEYLRANKFSLTIQQFVTFVKDEVIPTLGIEGRKTISQETV